MTLACHQDGKARPQSLVPTVVWDSGARDLGFSCGRGLNCFSPLNRGETAHYLLSHIFGSIYRKRYCKSFHCGSLEAEHYKRWLLKGTMRILIFFGVLPGEGSWENVVVTVIWADQVKWFTICLIDAFWVEVWMISLPLWYFIHFKVFWVSLLGTDPNTKDLGTGVTQNLRITKSLWHWGKLRTDQKRPGSGWG